MAQYRLTVQYAGSFLDLVRGFRVPEGAEIIGLSREDIPRSAEIELETNDRLGFTTKVVSIGGRTRLTPEAEAWLESQFRSNSTPPFSFLAKMLGVNWRTIQCRKEAWDRQNG